MKVISTERIPIKMWLDDLEDGAVEQAKNLANLPFAYKHIAIMPDSHQGYGMPIGGVLATKGVVIPNAVGVDIGCGMCVVKSSYKNVTNEQIKQIFGGSKEFQGGIRSKIPVGFNWHDKPQIDMDSIKAGHTDILTSQFEKASKQMGTLGGGNHFIELQEDEEGYLYIMIHSGSRNLGHTIANHYNKVAIELNKKWYSEVPVKHELAFLPLDTQEAKDYLTDMDYCVEFALKNRLMMIEKCIECVDEVLGGSDWGEIWNEPHNFARMENHGENVMVHRKGTTSAREGELGMIPGSQGTASYLVRGKGNKQSFDSCSHGAGRKMGRKQAQRELTLEDEQKLLNDQDIVHSVRNKKDLDESPSAYKDIDMVIENQLDLIEVVAKLKPRGVIKG